MTCEENKIIILLSVLVLEINEVPRRNAVFSLNIVMISFHSDHQLDSLQAEVNGTIAKWIKSTDSVSYAVERY